MLALIIRYRDPGQNVRDHCVLLNRALIIARSLELRFSLKKKASAIHTSFKLGVSRVYSSDRSKAVVLVLFLLFVALWFPHCFLFVCCCCCCFWGFFVLFFCCFFCFCFFFLFFSICVVMLALWSPSSKAAYFAFCFTSCVVVLAFCHLQQLPILLSVLLVVIKIGIGTQAEVCWP